MNFDVSKIATPYYVIDERLLIKNLEILRLAREGAGCDILLAQKGFSAYHFYPLIGRYLCGTTASSLFEARLGREHMPGEVHIYSPAYSEREFPEIVGLCDHIVFNSPKQLRKFKAALADARNNGRKIEVGIRVNPEYSEVETELYNPCAKNSRLGTTRAGFPSGGELDELVSDIDGLHFHALCEQNADSLVRVVAAFEAKFGDLIPKMKWVNFGGGHHITRPDYDVPLLIETVRAFRDKYGVRVYLEPGEAIALNAGFLVASVLETAESGMDLAILDTSAACHMPDVLEMPYRPQIIGAGAPGEKPFTYRLGGPTCLAGDIIGDYSFDRPLECDDKLIFCDMAHYTMVKNNTFNGVNLPSIAVYDERDGLRVIREFGYQDFKGRL